MLSYILYIRTCQQAVKALSGKIVDTGLPPYNPTQKALLFMSLDKYDYVILDIIRVYKLNNKNELIKLPQLEAAFWSRIEHDDAHSTRSAQMGSRVAKLYLEGYILNKNNQGYRLTKKGREELSYQAVEV